MHGIKKQINRIMNEAYCFEVETTYKSGRKVIDFIASENEEKMWAYYDKHHNKKLVEESVILDSWIY